MLINGLSEYEGIPISKPDVHNSSNLSSVWYYAQHKEKDIKLINSIFEEIYGQPLILKSEALPSHSFSKSIVSYNSSCLEYLFDTVYHEPHDTLGGIEYSLIYDTLFKEYVRKQGNYLLPFLKNIPKFEEIYEEYIAMVFTADGSELYEFWKKGEHDYDYPNWEGSDYLGFLLRRHHDNTLPTILELFMKALKEYDGEYYTYIQDNFGNSLQTYLRYYMK